MSSGVYRRIEEHVRKAAGDPDASKPEDAAAMTTKPASEQRVNMPGPARLSTAGSDLASTPNPWDALRVGARVLAAYWNEKREFEGVDSDAKCNPVDSIGSSTKSRVSHSERPPSARFPGDEDGSARRNIEPLQ